MDKTALISFFPRTDGDGMESMEPPITSDLKSVINATSNALQDLKVDSANKPLSPAAERVISLTPKAEASNKGKPSSLPAADKKAKFVPYGNFSTHSPKFLTFVHRSPCSCYRAIQSCCETHRSFEAKTSECLCA